jgi:hypothetical protein
MLFLFSFTFLISQAQDTTKTTVTHETSTTTKSTDWYMQPWAWVVGGVLLIIILVALFRGNSTTDKEVSRTTVIKDRDTRY